MGIYVNPGNENLKEALRSEIFVDKSFFISKISGFVNTRQKFVCVSRPRRFGKSMIGDLMKAYFSKGCDSKKLFSKLKIAKKPNFKKNLNKFNVLAIDFGAIFSSSANKNEIISNLYNKLLKDFRDEFPNIEFFEKDAVADLIIKVYQHTSAQFVIIIDEYDVLVRQQVSAEIFQDYLNFLNSLFKNNELSPAIALAYLTGILPIVRDKIQSKLNVFKESTMIDPIGFENFFGFTTTEVKALCQKYKMSFKECEHWYDGYKIGKISIYNPNSVVNAMMDRKYKNYWNITGSYEVISEYVKLDFDGTKSDVIDMMTGKEIAVNPNGFLNSLDYFNNKDDVFTYLIHLGYLNYNEETKLCRIPNREIKEEWEKALGRAANFAKIAEMIADSDSLLYLAQNGEAKEVAAALDKAHTEVSSVLNYNFESSLQAAIIFAFYTARTKYTIIQELPAGYGFADIGFIPLNKKDPAMIIELKCNHDAETAIKQIKNKNYPAGFENYLDNLLLIGVNYDKETKVHECVIEKYLK